MVICIVELWKKSMGYRFVPERNHAQKCQCQFFIFFEHVCRTTVSWDPEILPPWQHGNTTSPLY